MFRPVVTIDSRDAISNTTDGAVNIPSLAVEFLGQNALSVLFCAIETGAIIVLVARFFARKRERWAIQLLVYFVTLVAMYVWLFEHYLPLRIYSPSHTIGWEKKVSNGGDLCVHVASIGARVRQLGK